MHSHVNVNVKDWVQNARLCQQEERERECVWKTDRNRQSFFLVSRSRPHLCGLLCIHFCISACIFDVQMYVQGCLILIFRFPRKSPIITIISGSFAKNDMQLQASYKSSPPCRICYTYSCMHWRRLHNLYYLNAELALPLAASCEPMLVWACISIQNTDDCINV